MISKEKMAEMIRMCGKREKTKPNVTSEWKELAHKEYKTWKHD